jgi:hypothetical protein
MKSQVEAKMKQAEELRARELDALRYFSRKFPEIFDILF